MPARAHLGSACHGPVPGRAGTLDIYIHERRSLLVSKKEQVVVVRWHLFRRRRDGDDYAASRSSQAAVAACASPIFRDCGSSMGPEQAAAGLRWLRGQPELPCGGHCLRLSSFSPDCGDSVVPRQASGGGGVQYEQHTPVLGLPQLNLVLHLFCVAVCKFLLETW